MGQGNPLYYKLLFDECFDLIYRQPLGDLGHGHQGNPSLGAKLGFQGIILLPSWEIKLSIVEKMDIGGIVLFTLMFKRYTQGLGVAVEFHLIAGLVDQPLGAGFRE
jgi:hypothetical protein